MLLLVSGRFRLDLTIGTTMLERQATRGSERP